MPQRYTRFGQAYLRYRELTLQAVFRSPPCELIKDARGQMLFLSTMMYEWAGTNPKYPELYHKALDAALDDCKQSFDTCVVDNKGFAELVWQRFDSLCKGKANKNHTYGPVAGTIGLLHEQRMPKWSDCFRTMSPSGAWERLDRLQGVGPKLSSLILREAQQFLNVWDAPDRTEWYCFIPIDRWVLKIAKLLWGKHNWPNEDLGDAFAYKRMAATIAAEFESLEEAMMFDMGAWFLNSMRAEILALHDILFVGEWAEQEQALHDFAPRLDPHLVVSALAVTLASKRLRTAIPKVPS